MTARGWHGELELELEGQTPPHRGSNITGASSGSRYNEVLKARLGGGGVSGAQLEPHFGAMNEVRWG